MKASLSSTPPLTPICADGAHPFDRSGMAALSDLETEEWRNLFVLLEHQQTEFLAKESHFRSTEYKWPRDPLHTWSRVWEYPYVYHHLKQWRGSFPARGQPHVADIGSGVTFFPFAAARLDLRVTCTDLDPVCEHDLLRASRVMDVAPGSVSFRGCAEQRLSFEDGELDGAYCVSVLEHIANPENTVAEISRIMKPGGVLVLTIDLDLRGDSEIRPMAYYKLKSILQKHFDFARPEILVHPADLLKTDTGPFSYHVPQSWYRLWFETKQIIKPLLGRRRAPLLPFCLAIQGFVMTKQIPVNG